MKLPWTRLANMVKPGPFREERFQSLFLRHHRNASSILYSVDGRPLVAIYSTPVGMGQEDFIKVMKLMREYYQLK